MNTGKKIELARKEADLTQEELAKKIGITKATISKYERGDIVNIPPKSLIKLANYLNVSIDYLLERTNEPQPTINNSGKVEISGTQANIINQNKQQLDEMSKELLKKFKKLSFDDKIEVFNIIKQKEKK